jgi:hypothetical protein
LFFGLAEIAAVEVVALVGVAPLDLAAFGHLKAFFGAAVRLEFRHFRKILSS